MRRILQAAIATAALTASAVALPVYQTSFETAQGFPAGAFPTANTDWTVQSAPVTIEAGTTAAGLGTQFVRLGSGAILDFQLGNRTTDNVVWVEGYFRGSGSDVTLAEANYPVTEASAIVHFSKANGMEAFNGSAAVGQESVSLGVPLGDNNATTWFKVTIQLDFTAKTWDVYVNDMKKNSAPLGFRDNTLTGLSGFKNLAQGGADFDGFRIVNAIFGDVNGDDLVDSGDYVRLIDFIANPSGATDPILLGNANIPNAAGTRDGVVDGDDLTNLIGLLLQMSP